MTEEEDADVDFLLGRPCLDPDREEEEDDGTRLLVLVPVVLTLVLAPVLL